MSKRTEEDKAQNVLSFWSKYSTWTQAQHVTGTSNGQSEKHYNYGKNWVLSGDKCNSPSVHEWLRKRVERESKETLKRFLQGSLLQTLEDGLTNSDEMREEVLGTRGDHTGNDDESLCTHSKNERCEVPIHSCTGKMLSSSTQRMWSHSSNYKTMLSSSADIITLVGVGEGKEVEKETIVKAQKAGWVQGELRRK